jgi:hypothetical protein
MSSVHCGAQFCIRTADCETVVDNSTTEKLHSSVVDASTNEGSSELLASNSIGEFSFWFLLHRLSLEGTLKALPSR